MSTLPVHPNPKVAELEREAVRVRGDANQRSRYEAGLLPEEELVTLARAELFAPFERCARWHNRMLRSQAVRHRVQYCHGQIDFETCDVDELTSEQWDNLEILRSAMEIARDHHWIVRSVNDASARLHVDVRRISGIVITTTAHWATCRACLAEESRHTARVQILWAARTLSLEYLL